MTPILERLKNLQEVAESRCERELYDTTVAALEAKDAEIARLKKLAKEQGQEIAITRERDEALEDALSDMLDWADTPSQEASPSWIVGACQRARKLLGREPRVTTGEKNG